MREPIVELRKAEGPLVLAVDIGSSSVRSTAFDKIGRMVKGTLADQSYRMETPEPGAVQTDPDGLVDCVFKCVDETVARAGRLAHAIRGVSMSTFVSNILGVGDDDCAVTPLYTYADTRADADATALKATLDERTVHERTGCRLHTSYLPGRFRWIARTQPAQFQKATRWMSIGEYLLLRLFGEARVSYSVASWSGLLNWRRLAWDELVLAALPVKAEQLSVLTDIDQPLSGLRREFAQRWPSLRATPWYPAVGDGAAANIGVGCVSPGRVALTVGTTAALRIVTGERVARIPWTLWCYRVDRNRLLLGGALTEGGNVFAWMTKTLNLDDWPSVEEALASMPPDAHGLTVLPFLAGERSPGWAGHARASISGLSLGTSALDILRAGLEGVAFRLALVFEDLTSVVPEVEQVVANGGALLRSPTWLQIVADALGRPVSIAPFREASCRGAALLTLEALGCLSVSDEVVTPMGRGYSPDAARTRAYRGAMQRQIRLYEAVVGTGDAQKMS